MKKPSGNLLQDVKLKKVLKYVRIQPDPDRSFHRKTIHKLLM